MLKEDATLSLTWRPDDSAADSPPLSDYVRVRSAPESPAPRARRSSARPKHLILPVGLRALQTASTLPLQSYLAQRFSHIGGKSHAARAMRVENQRRHDLAADRCHWPMSRTS